MIRIKIKYKTEEVRIYDFEKWTKAKNFISWIEPIDIKEIKEILITNTKEIKE